MDALLERLPAAYLLLAVVAALLPGPRRRALAAAGAGLVGLAAAAEPAARTGSEPGFVTVNELLALGGLLLALFALVGALRGREGSELRLPPPLESAPAPRGTLLLLAGLALTAFAPHLILFGLGAGFAVSGAARRALRAGGWRGSIVLLALGAACVGFGLAALLGLWGPGGGALRLVAEAPISLAAERALTLLLGAGSLLLAGVPPFPGFPWGRALAPFAAILVVRVLAPAFPDGLLTWRVPALLLLAISLSWAAATRRWATAATVGGLFAAWSGAGVAAVAVLVLWGWLVELVTPVAARRGLRLADRWQGLAALPPGFVALPALRAGLDAVVSLSVLCVLGCVTGLLLQWRRGARREYPPVILAPH